MGAGLASYEIRSVWYKEENKERLLEIRNMIVEVRDSTEGLKRYN